MRHLAVLLALMTIVSTAVAADVVTLVANGKVVKSDPAPMINDGHVYVPLRAAAQAVGAEVEYYPELKLVRLCTATECTMVEQGEGVTVNGSLFLGIRKLGESLDCKVDWDDKSKTVKITTAAPALSG